MTGFSQQASIRKYLLCDWNVVGEDGAWQPDPLSEPMQRLLNVLGITATRDERAADLVVLVPKRNDLPLSARDARMFQQLLPCKKERKVLLLNRVPAFLSRLPYRSEWFHSVDQRLFDSKQLIDWLKRPFGCAEGRERRATLPTTDLAAWLNLVSDREGIRGNERAISRSGLKLIEEAGSDFRSDRVARFLWGLLRVSSRYARLEHDINRLLASDGNTAQLAELMVRKRFIDRCVDLRRSLPFLSLFGQYSGQSSQPSESRPTVLVIDDRPGQFRKELKTVIETLMPGFELAIWNPREVCKDKDTTRRLRLDELAQYSSLSSGSNVLEQELCIDGSSSEKLQTVLLRSRFVLVDILFEDERLQDREIGHRVIQGLIRLCRDLASRDDKPARPPKIVALSRSDDMDKIRATLLAGAKGYIVKSRLLSIPAVLGRMVSDEASKPRFLHRSFRGLYRLPDETISLLKSVHVPPLPQHNDQEHRDPSPSRAQESERVETIAGLLANLPKTDLHVHVGSCMSPEFLVLASLVMLARHPANNKIRSADQALVDLISGKKPIELERQLFLNHVLFFPTDSSGSKERDRSGLTAFGAMLSKSIENKLLVVSEWGPDYSPLRSVLHHSLGIRDHWPREKAIRDLKSKPPIKLLLFALAHGTVGTHRVELSNDDLLRVLILHLYRSSKASKRITWTSSEKPKLEVLLSDDSHLDRDDKPWTKLHRAFYGDDDTEQLSVREFRRRDWELPHDDSRRFLVNRGDAPGTNRNGSLALFGSTLGFDTQPLAYLLATGTRCTSLESYLHGCELSGAEHLRHPYLVHLYAQQVTCDLIRQGILYTELRAAVSGYANEEIGFSFRDACRCLEVAFQNALATVSRYYQQPKDTDTTSARSEQGQGSAEAAPRSGQDRQTWIWLGDRLPGDVRNRLDARPRSKAEIGFPLKIGLILTGKRHKPTREMLREAAAAVLLQGASEPGPSSTEKFVKKGLTECRLVGFDLAGPEEEYPPELFKTEFEQLSKLHIPITTHAGENATARFVESAMLDLRARRIGHGLAIVEDKQLMRRAREEGICVELCPVSNFQTNSFAEQDRSWKGSRAYPLRELLENGNTVCLNTDNPTISDTNIIKECFQASYAYGGKGLSLWELLRILRMGFLSSFLSLPERRAMLELADQLLFDLFSSSATIALLGELAQAEEASSSG